MSFPPRPPMAGMQVPMPFMNIPGMPPPGMPPSLMGGRPGGPPMQFFGNRPGMPVGPPPNLLQGNNPNMRPNRPIVVSKPPQVNKPDSNTMSNTSVVQTSGPPVTVFVGNITEKWPDAMIRQLLATCGQVVNWKRVQGASGKLQGFGFCEFNGPDAGLRAVRLLHGLEVGDKKLVVKVDGKTSTVLEEYKAERKLKIRSSIDSDNKESEDGKTTDGSKGDEDYMDDEMKEADDRSKVRIGIIFREFKNEIDSYVPPGSEKSEKETTSHKQHIQDKLHLLKLSSLDKKSEPADADADLPDEMMEEGKREIITREISNFRENMKQEKQKEEERKKIVRERRERERAREERRKDEKDRERYSPDRRKDRYSRSPGPRGANGSPSSRLRRSRSRTDDIKRIDRRRSRSRDRRDRGERDRRTPDRDRDGRRRRGSRERKSRSKSRERERSPLPQPKPRYREREEEEEAAEQKRLERKAREKEAAYEDRLRIWELREQKKAKELKREKEKHKRQEEEQQREAKKMKQFFEDYDDEKVDHKYYRGKELQKRLGDRAKELEADNKDRQKEREELEEIKLRMLTTPPGGTPLGSSRFNQYKKPMTDTTNTNLTSMSPFLKTTSFAAKADTGSKKSPIASRLQALAGGVGGTGPVTNNGLSPPSRKIPSKGEPPVATLPPTSSGPFAPNVTAQQPSPAQQQTSFSGAIQFSSFVPLKSNPTTPNSMTASPVTNVAQMSPSLKSLAGTGFQLTINNNSHGKDGSNFHDSKDEDSRNSFSFASPGMASPLQREEDDSSMPDGLSPADMPKKKKIDVKDVFNQDEDDNDGFGSGKKRKLVPLDFGEEAKKAKKEEKIPEDKKKHIKSLIDKIPTDKEALFSHEIDWSMLDNSLMEKRIRPWINKKIIDYIGEPEPTLVDFICSKVLGRSAPQLILDDVMMVLDEEAEVFVVKMWRLLVYEIAAKKYGISNKVQ